MLAINSLNIYYLELDIIFYWKHIYRTCPVTVYIYKLLNPLKPLRRYSFDPLFQLSHLFISNTVLVSLVCSMFNHIKYLYYLDICNNRLQNVESCDLLGLIGLRILNVSGNRLYSLAVHRFKFLTYLDEYQQPLYM